MSVDTRPSRIEDYERLLKEKFVGELAGQEGDFQCYLRCQGFGTDDFHYDALERLFFKPWLRSRRRGKFGQTLDRKRRQRFGPGKYWASSSSGVHLNKNFVKGWRGINPANP